MLLNESESIAVSTWGGIDKNSLWVLDVPSGNIQRMVLSYARYLSLYKGAAGFFSILHHFDSQRADISVHHTNDPGRMIARATMDDGVPAYEGDRSVWRQVSKSYTTYMRSQTRQGFALLYMRADELSVDVQWMDWFNANDYNLERQGIGDAVAVPGKEHVIIQIVNSATPVLYDPVECKVLKKLSLAGNRRATHGSNHTLRIRKKANELWADDFDFMVRLDTTTWSTIDGSNFHDEIGPNSVWYGTFVFDREESLCAISRPGYGDVIGVDTKTFKVTRQAKLGSKPLDIGLFSDGRIIARDWSTGELLLGQMEPI
ncbi:MAG: hypothetical protein ACYDAR_05140 [Thermomicrobiales bacterium]